MFALRSWTTLVHQMRDEAGRPLGEHRAIERTPAGATAPSAEVPMELVPCPYPGSRSTAGKPINASALRETVRHWRPAIALLARARSEVHVTTAMDVWWAGQLAESLPYLALFRQGGRPEEVTVAGPVAAAYKAMLGTNAGILGFVLDHPPAPELVRPEVDEVLRHVEERRLLVGPEQACAGPESLIRETLSVLIHGGARSKGADRLFDAFPGAVAFARARASLLVARLAFGLTAHAIFADMLDAPRGVPRETDDAIAQLVRLTDPTPDQVRFAAASPTDRLARLRGLLGGADAGDELLRSLERALAPDPDGGNAPDALRQAIARQQLLDDSCRAWIAGIKQRIVGLLPDDPRRDDALGLSSAVVPAQTPMRRLVTILAGG